MDVSEIETIPVASGPSNAVIALVFLCAFIMMGLGLRMVWSVDFLGDSKNSVQTIASGAQTYWIGVSQICLGLFLTSFVMPTRPQAIASGLAWLVILGLVVSMALRS